jgi:hypothetical protein
VVFFVRFAAAVAVRASFLSPPLTKKAVATQSVVFLFAAAAAYRYRYIVVYKQVSCCCCFWLLAVLKGKEITG